MKGTDSQFDQILLAAKERRGDLSVDTMIVSSHLAQMRMFMLRRGVEFFAEQDSYGYRKEFIAKVCEQNMLDMKLDSIVDYFLCDGQGLFYFRPSGDDYQLLYFPKENYRAYRDQNGQLSSVVLTYSFNVQKSANLMDYMGVPDKEGGRKKYIRLKVFKDRIEQTISDDKIPFDGDGTPTMSGVGATETLANSLGFIPAVEVFNYMDCTGEATGNGEFGWLSNQIMYHDELVKNVRKNLKFFGNPTLISSRPKHDIIESGDGGEGFRPTISSQAGFSAIGRSSTRVSEPFGGASALDGQIKVPRVIANLEPTDRISYLTPDSVSGDQNMYIKQYRSEIRLALGGVDDIDFGMASTAYEIKTLYGRVASTAEKKARALFTYGLCRLFSLMIKHEEKMFNESFAAAIGLEKPVIPLVEEFQDPAEYEAANEKYMKAMQKFEQQKQEILRATLESGDMPPGVTGLVPDGSTKVDWRWMGEVFEESSDEILQNSIVVRNLQEAGVGSIEALKYLFPNKTEEERAAMMSGFPFRVVQQTQSSINSFISLLGSLYQLPHPQTPDVPLASDPNLDLTGFLYRSLEYLRKELSYSGKYKPSGSDPTVSVLSDADLRRAAAGQPVRDERTPSIPGITDAPTGSSPTSGLPGTGPGSAGFGSGSPGESMAGSVPGAVRQFEYKQPLPGPGTVLGVPDADASSQYPGSVGFGAPTANPVFGAPDFQSPSFNPFLQSGAGSATAAKPSRKRPAKRSK